MVKKTVRSFFEQIPCRFENILVFKVSDELFAIPQDCLLFCAYVPPMNSPYYDAVEENDGISVLESCVDEISSQFPDCKILLCGDLNSRTGNYNVSTAWNIGDARSEALVETRHSRDNVVNDYGRSLLSFCMSFDLSILNGSEELPESGEFTFLSPVGKCH